MMSCLSLTLSDFLRVLKKKSKYFFRIAPFLKLSKAFLDKME
jgi:hypothetical protein